MFKLFISIGVLLLSVSIQAKTLLVFGDSLSAAYNLRQQDGWVSLMAEDLKSSHQDITVVNASVSGETSQGGLARLPALLERYQPNWVILELGANDGLRGYPLKQTQQNLATMIDLVTNSDAEVLLIGNHLPSNYGKTYTQQFFNLYKTLADTKKVAYIPFMLENVALDKSLMQSDGLHPNAEGQPVVLDNITPVLLPMLQ